jgi:hypothetical protein
MVITVSSTLAPEAWIRDYPSQADDHGFNLAG